MLAPDVLLALCLLACWLLRQPVMSTDLLRWTLDGRLPYLLLGDACADLLVAAGPHRPPVAALLPSGPRLPGAMHALPNRISVHRPLACACCQWSARLSQRLKLVRVLHVVPRVMCTPAASHKLARGWSPGSVTMYGSNPST